MNPGADEVALLRLLQSWRVRPSGGSTITRTCRLLAYAEVSWRPGDRYPPFE